MDLEVVAELEDVVVGLGYAVVVEVAFEVVVVLRVEEEALEVVLAALAVVVGR